MTMLLITKELAEAVVTSHWDGNYCFFCHKRLAAIDKNRVQEHTPECIVTRAKLLLEQEWGIKS